MNELNESPQLTLHYAMMVVEGTNGPPSLDAAAEQLGVLEVDLDDVFGVVPIDGEGRLYCVQVLAERIGPSKQSKGEYRGPFADPKIEPFTMGEMDDDESG